MSRINTNVSSLIAQRILTQQNDLLTKSLERLSTGFRINRGADDPAGLIASETLRSEKTQITAAIGNAERAEQLVNLAEGGLQEISTLLLEVQSLVSQTASDAGLSTSEKEANQQQIDGILQTIDRIASTTSFQGTKLLNGNFDFTVSAVDASVVDFSVNAAKLGDTNTAVQAVVTQSAQHAGLFLSLAATTLDLSTTNDRLVFEVAGALGSREFSFASGTATSAIAAQINTFTGTTGVSAATSGTGIVLKSNQFGSSNFVSVDITQHGDQAGGVVTLTAADESTASSVAANFTLLSTVATTGAVRDDGQDVGAIINGQTARGNGLKVSINTDALAANLELTSTASQTIGTIDAFTVTGGGASFNLGPKVDLNNQVVLGIGNVAARKLGTAQITDPDDTTGSKLRVFLDDLGSGKLLNVVDGDLTGAQEVVNNAVTEIASLRGRLGSFQQNVIGSTINALNVAFENVAAAESTIRDTDFASETATLTRAQILVAAASNVLAITNTQPQNVLTLLG